MVSKAIAKTHAFSYKVWGYDARIDNRVENQVIRLNSVIASDRYQAVRVGWSGRIERDVRAPSFGTRQLSIPSLSIFRLPMKWYHCCWEKVELRLALYLSSRKSLGAAQAEAQCMRWKTG